ncbi:phage GP46 family protein [Kiloniella majae]|uniref:phage GP46 family protein n=1 Tax=Kiloniella majae TaxID=1938558 RepID=UPI000A277A59|nr:phage GP46 family protein [Kiloniella majae]
MTDFAFENPTGKGFDFAHDGNDLVLGDGLLTSLIHALFRDGRAPRDRVGVGEDRRGHWSTSLSENKADGSLLWLLRREKITPDMPHRVAEILEQACDFMVRSTEGPTAPVTRVRAVANRSAQRGRIDAELIVYLGLNLEQRRFNIVYDINSGQYQLKETS